MRAYVCENGKQPTHVAHPTPKFLAPKPAKPLSPSLQGISPGFSPPLRGVESDGPLLMGILPQPQLGATWATWVRCFPVKLSIMRSEREEVRGGR